MNYHLMIDDKFIDGFIQTWIRCLHKPTPMSSASTSLLST